MSQDILPGNVTFDPLSDEFTVDPYPTYHRLREQEPVHYSALSDAWVLTRYEDVKDGLFHHDALLSQSALDVMGDLRAPAQAVLKDRVPTLASLVTADPPAHTNNRRPIQKALSARRVRAMQPRIEEIARELIEKVHLRGSAEFISEFAGPFPLAVIAELMGVPREDFGRFAEIGEVFKASHSLEALTLSDEEQVALAHAVVEADEYLLDLLRQRIRQPQDDFLSEIAQMVRPDGRKFDEGEILSLAHQLAVAATRRPRACSAL